MNELPEDVLEAGRQGNVSPELAQVLRSGKGLKIEDLELSAEEIYKAEKERWIMDNILGRMDSVEERRKRLNVDTLSFNSFYEYATQRIPDICWENSVDFDFKSFRFMMQDFYRGGDYEKTLNEELDSSLFDETFIVFEIDSIKNHEVLFPLVTLIIMDVFQQKCT